MNVMAVTAARRQPTLSLFLSEQQFELLWIKCQGSKGRRFGPRTAIPKIHINWCPHSTTVGITGIISVIPVIVF